MAVRENLPGLIILAYETKDFGCDLIEDTASQSVKQMGFAVL